MSAEVLAAHQIERGHRDTRVHCLCGWESAPGLPFRADIHLAHLAAALEPAIREREKAAWAAAVDCLSAHWLDVIGQRPVDDLDNRNPYETKEEA